MPSQNNEILDHEMMEYEQLYLLEVNENVPTAFSLPVV